MAAPTSASVFFAYGSTSPLRAETMRETQRALVAAGTAAQSWEDLAIEGKILVNTICAAIDASDAVIAEISELNSNVLFEAGYAVARNKYLWLAVDETDADAVRRWKQLAILETVGRIDYSGNIDVLRARWDSRQPLDTEEPALIETLLLGGGSREPHAVFAPSLPLRFQPAVVLEKFLDRQSHLRILGAGDDLGLAPLHFYVQEIYRSSAAIFHLLAPNRRGAEEHNARASFLAGVAYGFDLPVLMVVEKGFTSPLDYKDLLYVYTSTAGLQDKVRDWLETLPKAAGSNKRLGRLDLKIELPLRSFGQYVAEYERDELTDYFVETSEFRSIMAGDAKIFVGRKGTGKTATMSQAAEELRKDRRNLVVSVKPSAYELAGLVEVVKSLDSESSSEYVLLSLWSYLLYTEIALRTVTYAGERPASTGTNADLQALVGELQEMGVDGEDDLSTRLERAIDALTREARREGETIQAFISRQLRMHRLVPLKDLILRTLKDFNRVAVLIDNLDKAWEHGADYKVMSKFILSLLTAIGRVEKDFGKTPAGIPPVHVTLTVFLRTDIYDIVSRVAREPDKIRVLAVRWQDDELLVRVLEERYAANRSGRPTNVDMWAEVFPSEVRGIPARDYILWRALPRPRDLIYFANAALTTAINRKHRTIFDVDITYAENQYSQFAVEALLVESESEGFNLEEALYEFAGIDSTLTADDLLGLVGGYESPENIRDWLIRSSFLGLEVREGEFMHVEGETAARRQMKVAERFAAAAGQGLRFRVHPAFRRYLEIRDDDLHNNEIREVIADD
ncbi:MAG: hypothetical protein QM598_12380 [Protaetiibacter sp.]